MKRRNTLLRQLQSAWLPLALAIGFVGGMWVGAMLFGRQAAKGGSVLEKFNTVMNLIDTQYVDVINPDSLLEQTLPDLLSRLDPHSVYIPASELQATNDELAGSFSGIGVTFQLNSDTITVIEVISGGPSERVGLMPGDRIVTIDDSLAAGRKWSTAKVMSRLRGPEGTEVKLGVRRASAPQGKLLDFTVTRGEVPVTSIDAAYIIDPDSRTGYVKVNRFGAQTYAEFLTALARLRADGAEKFIVDLRGNGGGFMEQAILMANEFLPAGAGIVSTRGRLQAHDSTVAADGTGSFQDSQLVVILDEYSASASEIFAGAIQDNDRGLVVGRRSFGKGLVQNQIMLPDSSALRLTVARYYTPSGRCIQKTYTPGMVDDYNEEILDRYTHGETYSADSIHFNNSLLFSTLTGRRVYGGGGIMPDVFVPNDTVGMTSWYVSVVNAGLPNRFAFDWVDANRARLAGVDNIDDLDSMLPDDGELVWQFVQYAARNKVAPRWALINPSAPLLVNSLKALMARDLLGTQAFYEIYNTSDATIARALEELATGRATWPLRPAGADKATPNTLSCYEEGRYPSHHSWLQGHAHRA